jgi:hypothetical protein
MESGFDFVDIVNLLIHGVIVFTLYRLFILKLQSPIAM